MDGGVQRGGGNAGGKGRDHVGLWCPRRHGGARDLGLVHGSWRSRLSDL